MKSYHSISNVACCVKIFPVLLDWDISLYCHAAKSLQLCPTLCDPIDGSPPGSPVPGILQARILECVAISFSNAWKWKVKVKLLSRVRLLATRWTAAYQVPPSMGFSRHEYWSGVPSPSPSAPHTAAIWVFIYGHVTTTLYQLWSKIVPASWSWDKVPPFLIGIFEV